MNDIKALKSFRKLILFNPNGLSKTSNLSQQEIRRIHFLGEEDCTCRVVIPSRFVKHLGIAKGTYLKMSLDEQTDKITVEKLDSQELQDDR